jgi:hypothetical protein
LGKKGLFTLKVLKMKKRFLTILLLFQTFVTISQSKDGPTTPQFKQGDYVYYCNHWINQTDEVGRYLDSFRKHNYIFVKFNINDVGDVSDINCSINANPLQKRLLREMILSTNGKWQTEDQLKKNEVTECILPFYFSQSEPDIEFADSISKAFHNSDIKQEYLLSVYEQIFAVATTVKNKRNTTLLTTAEYLVPVSIFYSRKRRPKIYY